MKSGSQYVFIHLCSWQHYYYHNSHGLEVTNVSAPGECIAKCGVFTQHIALAFRGKEVLEHVTTLMNLVDTILNEHASHRRTKLCDSANQVSSQRHQICRGPSGTVAAKGSRREEVSLDRASVEQDEEFGGVVNSDGLKH